MTVSKLLHMTYYDYNPSRTIPVSRMFATIECLMIVGCMHAESTGGENKTLKEKVLVYDEENGDLVWEVVEDPRLKKMRNTMKVTPSPDNPADSKIAWKCEYELADPSAPPPKEVEVIHHAVMKAIMNYVDTHPTWP